MISFTKGNLRFNYRVAGIALHEDHVLIHKAETDDFWTLPGGRVDLLESSSMALKREMKEELDVEIEVERLLWFAEGFFDHNDWRKSAKRYHELALYYLMTFPEKANLFNCNDPFFGSETLDNGKPLQLIFQWYPIGTLERISFYPAFLRKALRQIPEHTLHVIAHDAEY